MRTRRAAVARVGSLAPRELVSRRCAVGGHRYLANFSLSRGFSNCHREPDKPGFLGGIERVEQARLVDSGAEPNAASSTVMCTSDPLERRSTGGVAGAPGAR
ncbi:MAG TPA: hypothetical protein VL242_39460 [Sorangium sp.]|nr:hypothetical protein [Sorangium sp.]